MELMLPLRFLPEALGLVGTAPALACFCCACCTAFLSAPRASKNVNRPTLVLRVSRTAAAAAWPACPACRHSITFVEVSWFQGCPKLTAAAAAWALHALEMKGV